MLKDHKLHLTIVILDTQIDILNYLYLYLDLYWLSHTKAFFLTQKMRLSSIVLKMLCRLLGKNGH